MKEVVVDCTDGAMSFAKSEVSKACIKLYPGGNSLKSTCCAKKVE